MGLRRRAAGGCWEQQGPTAADFVRLLLRANNVGRALSDEWRSHGTTEQLGTIVQQARNAPPALRTKDPSSLVAPPVRDHLSVPRWPRERRKYLVHRFSLSGGIDRNTQPEEAQADATAVRPTEMSLNSGPKVRRVRAPARSQSGLHPYGLVHCRT